MAYSDARATSGSGLRDHRSDTSDDPCSRDPGRPITESPTINPVTIVMGDTDTSLIPPAFSRLSGIDADSSVRRFANYCEYRHVVGDDRLPLFRLLLVDAATDWLQVLSEDVIDEFEAVQPSY